MAARTKIFVYTMLLVLVVGVVVCYRSVTQQDIGLLYVTTTGIVIVHMLLVVILDIMTLVSEFANDVTMLTFYVYL